MSCACDLVGMLDLSACMLHGSAAESSSSKWLSLLSASSFPVVSLHHQLSAPKTSCWCRTDSFAQFKASGGSIMESLCFHMHAVSLHAAMLFWGESENIFEHTGDKFATDMMHTQRS